MYQIVKVSNLRAMKYGFITENILKIIDKKYKTAASAKAQLTKLGYAVENVEIETEYQGEKAFNKVFWTVQKIG